MCRKTILKIWARRKWRKRKAKAFRVERTAGANTGRREVARCSLQLHHWVRYYFTVTGGWKWEEIIMAKAMSRVCLVGRREKLESPLFYDSPICFFNVSGGEESKSYFILEQILEHIFRRQLFGSVRPTYFSLSRDIMPRGRSKGSKAMDRYWLGLERRPLAKATHLWQSGYKLVDSLHRCDWVHLVHLENPVEGEASECALVYESWAMNSPSWIMRILPGVKSAPINWHL